MHRTQPIFTLFSAAMLTALPGCIVDKNAAPVVTVSTVDTAPPDSTSPTGESSTAWPFAPRSLRIHPLTHVDAPDPSAGGILILHVELRDRFGDSVKGVGALSVDLSRGPANATAAPQTRVHWDLGDMSDPETSSRRFDPSTRTYRIPLKAPAWVGQWLADESERRGGPQSLTLRASFAPSVGEDRRVLTDEYGLEP